MGTGIRRLCFFCVIYILMLSYLGDYTLKRRDLTLLRRSEISRYQSDTVESRGVGSLSVQRQAPEKNTSNDFPSGDLVRGGQRSHGNWLEMQILMPLQSDPWGLW